MSEAPVWPEPGDMGKCFGCEYQERQFGRDHYTCIALVEQIPEWCPLPDAPEEAK